MKFTTLILLHIIIDESLPKLVQNEQTSFDLTTSLIPSRSGFCAKRYTPGFYPDQYFTQLIDHEKDETYQQRYFVNADFYKAGGPAFVYITGEGASSNRTVTQFIITELAKEHGGIIYGLEHRFYGKSQPFKLLTVDNLKLLTSHNSLLDLQRFAKKVINPITRKFNDKWYAIGGSYAGTLSAWARQAFPDIFRGSLASSAPVLAKDGFFEFDMSIKETLGPKCSFKLEQIVNLLDNSYSMNRSLFLDTKNKLGCWEISNDIHFLYTLYDTVAAIVQYNSVRANPNVASMCRDLEATKDSYQTLNSLIQTLLLYYKNYRSNCYKFSSHQDILNIQPNEKAMMRQWNYQCCTEFGFWQTAPKYNPMRSKLLTVDWFNNFFCSSEFYGQTIGPPRTDSINQQHKGLDINTNFTIFTNGDWDPWSKLSLFSLQHKENRPVFIIRKGSHVTDFGVPSKNDSPSLIQTRASILSTFRSWIK